jgi:hypothetical protein
MKRRTNKGLSVPFDSSWRDVHLGVTNSKGEVSKPLTLGERRFETSETSSSGGDLTSFNLPGFNHFPPSRLEPDFGRSNAVA